MYNWESLHARLKCHIVTARYGITRKKSTRSRKRLKYRGNVFKKNLQLKGAC